MLGLQVFATIPSPADTQILFVILSVLTNSKIGKFYNKSFSKPSEIFLTVLCIFVDKSRMANMFHVPPPSLTLEMPQLQANWKVVTLTMAGCAGNVPCPVHWTHIFTSPPLPSAPQRIPVLRSSCHAIGSAGFADSEVERKSWWEPDVCTTPVSWISGTSMLIRYNGCQLRRLPKIIDVPQNKYNEPQVEFKCYCIVIKKIFLEIYPSLYNISYFLSGMSSVKRVIWQAVFEGHSKVGCFSVCSTEE